MAATRLDEKVGELELIHLKPASPGGGPPLLFVHGAWHGAWCWADQWLGFFASQGHEVYAVSLRGHGRSGGDYRGARVRHYVDDAWTALKHLGRPAVLIGHSMGGYLGQFIAAAEPLAGLVLVAPVPHTGVSAWTYVRTTLKHPWLMLRSALSGDGGPLVSTKRATRDLLFSAGLPDSELERHLPRLQGESFRALLELGPFGLRPARPRPGTPVLCLAADGDGLFSPREAQRTAEAYGAQYELLERCGHDVMLEPRALDAARRVDRWIAAHVTGATRLDTGAR